VSCRYRGIPAGVRLRGYPLGMDSPEREAAAVFALLRTKHKGVSWGSIASEIELAGSATALLEAPDDSALFPAVDGESALAAAAAEIRQWRTEGYQFVTVLDDCYPARLRDIREVPPFLFYEGALHAYDEGMSVVGSRSASSWGLEFAAAAARHLVSEGLTVIAGLAVGVDTAAHRAALDNDGRTVAFIGTGIANFYPRENAELQREIAKRGLVLSQFYPETPPTKQTFPIRNASMSGYGLATIVVEAGELSGTRIQARLAGEHGRPVILTERVVEATSWGRGLVVSSIRDLKVAIDQVRQTSGDLREALRVLTEL
jgi:DNA processing protein